MAASPGCSRQAFLIGLGRRAGAGQPDRRIRIVGAVRDLRRRAVGRRGGGVRQPAQFRRWRAGRATTRAAVSLRRCCGTGHIGRRCSPTSRRAGRPSVCGSRWCRCSSSRCWVAEPGVAGLALATFAIGNISVVIPSGYLSDRIGRRKLLIVGLTVAAVSTALVGLHHVAAGVPGRRPRRRRGHRASSSRRSRRRSPTSSATSPVAGRRSRRSR